MEYEPGFEPLTGLDYVNKWLGTIKTAREQAGDKLLPWQSPAFWRNVIQARVERPVFIVGCPRSGTTMLGRVIDAVPTISQYHEPNLDRYYPKLVYQNSAGPGEVRRYYSRLFTALIKLAPKRGGARFAEKNPHNTWAVDTLNEVYPDAKFIYIYRDGRDVTCSFLRHPWHREESPERERLQHNGYRCGPYPHYYIEPERREEYTNTSDVHRCAWVWRRYVEKGLDLRARYAPDKLHVIKYEDLIHNPEEEVTRMLKFLDEYNETAFDQVMAVAGRGHAKAIGRWKKLSEEDLNTIYREAAPMLKAHGYADEVPLEH
jgi:hypothetical protein